MAELLPHSGVIRDGTHILPLRVYYEDTDAGGVVYYANYLKYMERGRSDMLRKLGIDQVEMLKFENADDVKFVIVRSEIDYIRSAKLDDEITVHTRISEMGKASLVMDQEVRRSSDFSGDILAKGMIRVAVLNKQGKATRLPKKISDKLGC